MRRFLLFMSLLMVIFISFLPIGCSQKETNHKTEILISAASSLTDVLNELKPLFEKENPNIKLIYNFGGSGNLSQQIEHGAPSDVFLSANESFMNRLIDKELILTNTKVNFASNTMVFIAHKNSKFNDYLLPLNNLNDQVIAIGNPDVVPAGAYARQILQSLNLWDGLQGNLVFSKNVRQVLAYIESGNADIGIVYQSDSFISDKVKIIGEANSDWHETIVYPSAVVKDSEHIDLAKKFLSFLVSDIGKEVLQKHGFSEAK